MDNSDSHDDALANRILKYAAATSKTSDLPPFPGDDVESLPSDYEYDENEEYDEEEVEEISEMELLGHLDASMPPILLAQELFNSDVDSSTFNVLTSDNANELFHQGYTVLNNVLPLSTIQSVRQWATEMFKTGKMDKASGKHNEEDDPFREGNARGDYTIWVSPGSKFLEVSPELKECVDWFSGRLHEDLAKVVHLHGQAEYQLAYYPPDSSHYERHRDSFPTDDKEDVDQRRVTVCSPSYVSLDILSSFVNRSVATSTWHFLIIFEFFWHYRRLCTSTRTGSKATEVNSGSLTRGWAMRRRRRSILHPSQLVVLSF